MRLRNLDRVFTLLLLLFGLYIIWTGSTYGYMQRNVPGAGFFPIWAGVMIAVLSLLLLAQSWATADESSDASIGADDTVLISQLVPALGVVGAILVYLLLAPFLGMLLPLPLLVLGSAYAIRQSWDRATAARIIAIALLLPVACYVVFAIFLGVRLIEGPFGF